jgi:hypothetical protein
MPAVVWQNLAKNQSDPEKVEQAVDRKIQNHNDDVNAHLGENQALTSHRAEDIIDHLASSIVMDKIRDFNVGRSKLVSDKPYIYTAFESLDFWSMWGVGGAITGNFGTLTLFSGNVIGNHQYAALYNDILGVDFEMRNPVFQGIVLFGYSVGLTCHFGIGAFGDVFAGFEMVNGVLKACVYDYSRTYHSIAISGIDLSIRHSYRAEVISEDRVDFFIDGVLVGSISGSMAGWSESIFEIYLSSASAHNHNLYVLEVSMVQDVFIPS